MRPSMLLLLAWCSGVAACGRSSSGGTGPASAGATPATDGSAAGGVLTLGEVAFFDGEGRPGPVLHADGRVEMEGSPIGTLAGDGSFTTPDGTEAARLHADGRLVVSGNEGQTILVSDDGRLTIDGRAVFFDGDGVLSGEAMAGPTIRAEGLTPETRRAAAVLLLLTVVPRAAEAPPGGPSAPPGAVPATTD